MRVEIGWTDGNTAFSLESGIKTPTPSGPLAPPLELPPTPAQRLTHTHYSRFTNATTMVCPNTRAVQRQC
jgi:hypothetical protein